MNRAERRQYMKKGATPETLDTLDKYNSPCSIAEAVQIARATAEDVVEGALVNFQRNTSPLQIALSLQVEILKEVLISAGLMTEEQFKKAYSKAAGDFNKMQRDYMTTQEENPSMKVQASDVDVKILED